jgi:hypothetical protein
MSKENFTGSKGKYSVYLLVPDQTKTGAYKPIMIDNVDIVECYFIEDIYALSMIGRLSFVDRVGAVELLPFTGNEYIAIKFGEDKDVEVVFDIFNVANIEQFSQAVSSGQSIIELYISDQTFRQHSMFRYSKAWTNTLISDIVKDITKNMIGIKEFVQFEPTNERIDFYMPYWTPGEAIRWLMQRATGAETMVPGYVYYMNRDGCNFVTLEKLFQSKQIEMSDDKKPLYYQFTSMDKPDYINTMLNWQMNSVDSQALQTLRGGTRMGFDFMTKGLLKKKYTYTDAIKKFTMVGNKTLFPDISADATKFVYTGEADERTMDNIYLSEFIKRYSVQMNMITLLKGHERRLCGGMVEIQWPSSEKTEYINKSMEGKYLIKQITHQFSSKSSPTYRQKVVMMRNAYSESDGKNLVKSTKFSRETNVKKIGKS